MKETAMNHYYEVFYDGHKIGFVSATSEHDAFELAVEQCLQSSLSHMGILAGELIDKRRISVCDRGIEKFRHML